ncbi:MAG: hypothetical protein AAGA85_05920 [Bacteroidota bacterium]
MDIYERYNIYRSPILVFLNQFSITLSSGYGATNYNHDLSGFYFYQDASRQVIVPKNEESLPVRFAGFTDWLNAPTLTDTLVNDNFFDVPYRFLPNPVFNDTLRQQVFLLDTDTAALSFSGVSHSIPVNLSIHYNYKEFRFGGGIGWERQYVRPLNPQSFEEQIRPYQPNFSKTSFTRWYGLVGYKFYDYYDFSFVGELEVGRATFGRQFNNELLTRGVYARLGISIEQNWSEYFRLLIKPSYEFKNYTIAMPEGMASVKHNQNTFFLQFGISINIPEIPRTPMKSDHVQLKHVITDPATGRLVEVRGQPIWKKQNPKVGENHRKLWRYKNRNKRKLNPY